MLKRLRSKQSIHKPVDVLTTLRRDLARITAGTAIRIKVEQSGHPIPLRPKVESAVLNVAQQAVTNALRHSGQNHTCHDRFPGRSCGSSDP